MKNHPLRVLCFPKRGGNPYLNLFSSRLEDAGLAVDEFSFPRAFRRRYDVVHMHWPDTHLRSTSWWRSLGKHVRLAVLCTWLRLRGTRVVWTLHNLRAHEKNHWIGARLFPLWFPRLCTQVIALTPTGLELARLLYPPLERKQAAIIPHGHYRDVFPRPADRESSRSALGLPTKPFTFVYFGYIRAYKNVALLIEIFRRMTGSDVQLVVAGEPVVGIRAADLEQAAQGDSRVHLLLRHIEDAEVPVLLGAADLVVTPFSNILNSGSVMLALSLNRPVLAPRVGALPDVQREVGAAWLRLYDGGLDVEVLAAAQQEITLNPPCGPVDLSAFDWAQMARATVKLCSGAPEPRPAPPVLEPVNDARLAPPALGRSARPPASRVVTT